MENKIITTHIDRDITITEQELNILGNAVWSMMHDFPFKMTSEEAEGVVLSQAIKNYVRTWAELNDPTLIDTLDIE